MNRIVRVLFLVCIFLFSSCEKFDDQGADDLDNGQEIVSEEIYELMDIEFFLIDGEGMQEELILLNSDIFTNNTSSEVQFPFQMQQNQHEESHFIPNKPTTFKIREDENKNVEMPTLITNDTIHTNYTHFRYVENVNVLFPSNVEHTQMINCPAFSVTSIYDYMRVNRFVTGYRAIFEWRETGKRQTVEGKWTGTQIGGSLTDVQVDDIKN